MIGAAPASLKPPSSPCGVTGRISPSSGLAVVGSVKEDNVTLHRTVEPILVLLVGNKKSLTNF